MEPTKSLTFSMVFPKGCHDVFYIPEICRSSSIKQTPPPEKLTWLDPKIDFRALEDDFPASNDYPLEY